MALIGTLLANQPSSVGPWFECTIATAQAVTGTTTTTGTIIVPTAGMYQINPNLPIACTVLNPATATAASGTTFTTLQGGTNSILDQQSTNTGGIGIAKVLCATASPGTLTLTFVNAGASSTLSVGTRLLFVQNQGN